MSESLAELKRLIPQCLLPDQIRLGSALVKALKSRDRADLDRLPLDRWLARAKASIAARAARRSVLDHLSYPETLPITGAKETIVGALRHHSVIVVAGETGSGKTTQLPKMCLESGLGIRARIGCTQPRRVAATSISRRLAEELRVEWGREVGCKIRFADRARAETSIKVMTDGILLAELQADPLLTEYEAIIIDEAHERSLNIDFLLGYLRQLLKRRDDLKVIVTSATIDTELFSQAFDGAPVIEVSGRLYPVETRYWPLDEHAEEEGEATYIDAAVNGVRHVLDESPTGDVLVFMPGERDIRETCEKLKGLRRSSTDVIPLFGRLSSTEQERIFSPGPQRRVVVATNIAETSLTVPRIRYVVDTGLARISHYHAGTRGKRLPVEPISQSSANQRQGRCGRLTDGVCTRLYSKEDFETRPPHTQPEIQRCNLADVILRMRAYRLGEVETFPFVEPPSPQAIRSAYGLLQELGALDEDHVLTDLGRELARLPVDAAIGRMILQARQELALSEVLIIAAGLSIQDPRERPFDQRDTAEAAHRKFQDPGSDFLTLLNIWRAYHDTWESLKTQNQLRKFCKSHFLSYLRMREWRDVHLQLRESLREIGRFRPNVEAASYDAIHRSLLPGLWGHVARREEKNTYRTSGNRQVHVFPGSTLFEKPTPPRRRSRSEPETSKGPKTARPRWVVAGEFVVTSREFARTLAGIRPEWILELAPHLCRQTHRDPRWDQASGCVIATERTMFRGLLVRERIVPYSQVNPVDATELFIRAALIEGQLGPERRYPFLEHNLRVRRKVEVWQTRMRHRGGPDLDRALFEFYAARLQGVASIHDLERGLKSESNRPSLRLGERDLIGQQAEEYDPTALPDAVSAGSRSVPVSYAYAPGEDDDGMTVTLTVPLARVIDPEILEWAVPALREERVLALLRGLPKAIRRPLMPLPSTARAIAEAIDPAKRDYLRGMTDFLRRDRNVDVPTGAWKRTELPAHLRPRYRILDRDEKVLASGRDLNALRESLQRHESPSEAEGWRQAIARWERYDLRAWEFDELPREVLVREEAHLPLHGYPGLHMEDGKVNLRLFRRAEEARDSSRLGAPALAEKALKRELHRLQNDLRELRQHADLYVTLGPVEELIETAWENARNHLLADPPLPPTTRHDFQRYLDRTALEVKGLAPRFVARIGAILRKRQEALVCARPFPGMRTEIDSIVPAQFLRYVSYQRLPHLARYLQALLIRAERAAVDPVKDAQKAQRIHPYVTEFVGLSQTPAASFEKARALDEYRWLIEEFKVSCFAQELGTAAPVSEKRLQAAIDRIRGE